MNCKRCGAEFQENVNFCPNCGERTEEIEVRGMKWHKFNAYFIMPLGAIINLFAGALFFPGVMNKLIALIPDVERLYLMNGFAYMFGFESVRILNAACSFVLVAMAFYYVYVSFALIKYKKTAIKHVYIRLVLTEVIGFVYSAVLVIVMSIASGFNAESIPELVKYLISRIITVAFWLFVYNKYYDKRKHMFIN